MKIEKISDHQIKCTLNKEDLADRELKLSELAYGTEKAKQLFRDVMQQASFEFGFEVELIPLMVEAIPLSADCIVLIFTKVEDPEELDTRFSKFAPSVHEDAEETAESLIQGADEILDLFKKIQEARTELSGKKESSATPSASKEANTEVSPFKQIMDKMAEADRLDLLKLYIFDTLRDVTAAAKVLKNFYKGSNALYKGPDGGYILSLRSDCHTPMEFNKVCNILSEYSCPLKAGSGADAYLKEHCEPLLKENALQSLASL